MYSSSSSSEDYRKYTAFPNNKLKDVVRKVSSFFNNVAARLPKSKKALKKELKRYRIQAEFYESEVASAAARLSHRDFEITRMKKTVSSLEAASVLHLNSHREQYSKLNKKNYETETRLFEMTGLMNKLNEEMELMKKKKDINDLQLTVSAEEIERLENHVENLKSHALQLLEDKQEALLLQFEYRMVENVLVKVPMKRGSELEDKIEDTNDQQKEKMIAISDYSKEMDPAPVQVAIEDTFVPSFKEECKDIDEISIDSTLSENFVSAVQSLEQHELQLDQAPFETKRTAAAAYWSKILQRWFKL